MLPNHSLWIGLLHSKRVLDLEHAVIADKGAVKHDSMRAQINLAVEAVLVEWLSQQVLQVVC